jgi:hypothetical protein
MTSARITTWLVVVTGVLAQLPPTAGVVGYTAAFCCLLPLLVSLVLIARRRAQLVHDPVARAHDRPVTPRRSALRTAGTSDVAPKCVADRRHISARDGERVVALVAGWRLRIGGA